MYKDYASFLEVQNPKHTSIDDFRVLDGDEQTGDSLNLWFT